MEKGRFRKLLPGAAAAVCFLSAAALALWFFHGAAEGGDASDSPVLPQAQHSVALLTGYDCRGAAISQGRGFYAFSDNIIVTTFHTIDYCSKVLLSDEPQAGALRVLAYDPQQDFAVLKLPKSSGSTVLPCGGSQTMYAGEALTALDVLTGGSVCGTSGSFAGRARSSASLLWTGSSDPEPGCPLVDGEGRVVGMVTGSNENGSAQAVPIEAIRALLFLSEAETTPASVCAALHPGLDCLPDSTAVDFFDLILFPERYEGKRVRLTGYTVDTEEYTATARPNLIFLLPPGSTPPEEAPVVSPWEGMRLEGYFFYWFFTPFAQSRLLRCMDRTHRVKTARYQGRDTLVCGNFHYEQDVGYGTLELMYADTPRVLEVFCLPDP